MTVPIAVSVAEPLGGIITITSVVVFVSVFSAVSSVPGCFGVAGSRILWHRDSRWGLRRMASERPVRSKSVRWKGAQRFGYGTDGDHDGPAAAGDREIPLLIFCLPEKGLPLQKFFRAEA